MIRNFEIKTGIRLRQTRISYIQNGFSLQELESHLYIQELVKVFFEQCTVEFFVVKFLEFLENQFRIQQRDAGNKFKSQQEYY